MVLVDQAPPLVQVDGKIATSMIMRKEHPLQKKKIAGEKKQESAGDGDLFSSPYRSRSEPFQDMNGETVDAQNSSSALSERSPRVTKEAGDHQNEWASSFGESIHEMTDPSRRFIPFIGLYNNTSQEDASSRCFSLKDLDVTKRQVCRQNDDKKKRWTTNFSIHPEAEEEEAFSSEYIYSNREVQCNTQFMNVTRPLKEELTGTQRGKEGLYRYKGSMTGDLLTLPAKPTKEVQDNHVAERRDVSSVFSPPVNHEKERGVHTPHDIPKSLPPSLPAAVKDEGKTETPIMQWPTQLSSSSLSSSSSRMKEAPSLPFSHPSDLPYGSKASSSLHDLSSYTTTTTSPRDVSSDNSSTISEDKNHEETLKRCTYTRGTGVISKKGDKGNEKEEKDEKDKEEEDSLKLLIGSSHTTSISSSSSSPFFDVCEEGKRRQQNQLRRNDDEDENHNSEARFSCCSSSSSLPFSHDEERKEKKAGSSSFLSMTNHKLTRRPETVWRELDSFACLQGDDETKDVTLPCIKTPSSSSRRQSSSLIPPRFYRAPASYHKNAYPPSLKNLFSSFSSSPSSLVSPSTCESTPLSVFCERRRQNSLSLSHHHVKDVCPQQEHQETEEEEEHVFSTVSSPSCSPPPSSSGSPRDSRTFSISFSAAEEESLLSSVSSSNAFSFLSLSSSHVHHALSPPLQGVHTSKPDSSSRSYPLAVFSSSSSGLPLHDFSREISSLASMEEEEEENDPFSARNPRHSLRLRDLHHPDQRGLFFPSQDISFLKGQEKGEAFVLSKDNLLKTLGEDKHRNGVITDEDRSLCCLHQPPLASLPPSSSGRYISPKKIEGRRDEREKGGGEEEDDDIFITSAVFFREQRFSSSISWAMFLLGVGVFLPWNCLIMEMATFDVLYFPTFPWTEAATQVRTACFFLGQLILLWIGPRLKLFPRTIGTLVFSSLTNLSLALIVVFLKNERIAFHICCVLSGLIGLQGSLLHASVYVLHAIIHHELAVDWSIGGGLAGPITAFLAFPLYFLLPGLTPQWSSRVRTLILFGFASLWSILSVIALALAVKNPFVSRALSQQEQMKSLFLLNRNKTRKRQKNQTEASSSSCSSSTKRCLLLSLLFLHDRKKGRKAYLEGEQGRRGREDDLHELLKEDDEDRRLRADSRSSSLPHEDEDSDKSSRSSPRTMMVRLGSHEEGEGGRQERRDKRDDSHGYSLLTGWRFRSFHRLPSTLFERGKSLVLDIFQDPESRRNQGDEKGRRRSLQDEEEEEEPSSSSDHSGHEDRRRGRHPTEEDLREGGRRSEDSDDETEEGSTHQEEEEESEVIHQRRPLLLLSHEDESHREEPEDRRQEGKKNAGGEEEDISIINPKKKTTSPRPCESSLLPLPCTEREEEKKKKAETRRDVRSHDDGHRVAHHKKRWRRRDVMWNIRSNLLTCFLLFLSTYIVYPVKTERLMPSSNTLDFVLFQMILVACFQAGNVLGRFFVFWGCRAPFSCLLPLVSFRLLLIPFFFFLDGSLVLSPTATPAWMKPDDALWLSRDPANEATTSSHTFLHNQLPSSSSSPLHDDRERLHQHAEGDFFSSSSTSRLYDNHLLHPHHSQYILSSPLTSSSREPRLDDLQLHHSHNRTSLHASSFSSSPSDLLFPDLFQQQPPPQDSSGFLSFLFPFGDVTALELRGILSDLCLFLLMMVFSTLHGWLSVLGAYYATQVPSSSSQKETAAYLMCLAESCGVALGAGLSIIWASLTGCHPLSPHHHGYRPGGIQPAATPTTPLGSSSSSTPFSASSLSTSSFMRSSSPPYHMTSPQSVGDPLHLSSLLSAPTSHLEGGRRRSDIFSLHPSLLDNGLAGTSSSFHAGMERIAPAGGHPGVQTGPPLLSSPSAPPALQHVPKIG